MATIQDQILTLNKWQYDPGFRTETSSRYRDLFYLLTDNFIDKEVSLSISGLRRVGKTTILFQIINFLLNRKTDPRHIFYFQFSEMIISLEKTLETYFSRFTDEEISRDEFYIFLDELQYVKNWQNTLKKHIDRNKKIKFIVTISASLSENFLDFKLDPLSFSEMIRLKDNYEDKHSINRILTNDNDIENNLKKLNFERLPFQKYFKNYLRFGEFPALIPYFDNFEYANKYLQDGIIDKILQKDIRLFEVEKQDEINLLYRICCSNTAQMINLKNVSRETELSYPTIKKYLSVLKKTFLVDCVKNRLRSIKSQEKSLDKVFSTSINLTSIILSINDPLNPPYLDFKGHIIESFVYNSIKQLGNIYYYKKNGKEVDLILESGNKIIPIEVKSANILKKTDIYHLVYFMEKNKLDTGFVVYGGELKIIETDNKKIHLLPYYLF